MSFERDLRVSFFFAVSKCGWVTYTLLEFTTASFAMNNTLKLEDLINASGTVVINGVEMNNADFCPGGDPDCAVFHMADETMISFDPDQQVTLKDGQAEICVTYHGERTRTNVMVQFFTLEKLTPEKVLAAKAG